LKINDTNGVLAWLRTIDECRPARRQGYYAPSNGKPVVSSITTSPNVRFASISKMVPVVDETALAINYVPVLKKALKKL
jgi:hypothetical protein